MPVSSFWGMDRRIAIVKLGSSSVTRDEGPDPVLFAQTMQSIGRARAAGWSVVLVSSGAAALGSVLLNARGGPGAGDAPGAASRHLRSAVGQPELMSLYRFLGDTCRVDTCQLLLSEADLQDPERMQRIAQLVHEALAAGHLPILNGNDSTDANVYDNDSLAASVAIACRAEHLLLLTDVAGVLTGEGEAVFDELRPQDVGQIASLGGSRQGTGGIQSKVRSASLAALNGVRATIAQASEPEIIDRVLGGEAIGTAFAAQAPRKTTLRALWIGGIASTSGRVIVNLEAEESITRGASLFASGVKRVIGTFGPDSIVEITDPSGRPIGRGAIRVSSDLLGLGRAMQPEETVELHRWLLRQVADLPDEVAPGSDEGSSPRAQRAIESARKLSTERVAAMAREVLQMVPSIAAAALFGSTPPSVEQSLLAHTQRFSLIDNRSLVVFPSAQA